MDSEWTKHVIPDAPPLPEPRIEAPHHYDLGGVQVADVQEIFLRASPLSADVAHHLAMVLRYVMRAGRKKGVENAAKDLAKAGWHLERARGLLP